MPETSRDSRPLERVRSADVVTAQIIEAIAEGRYRPGDRIGSEQDLVEGFRVSRATIREALRMLERDGAIYTKPGPRGGIFCGSPEVGPLARSIRLYGLSHDVAVDDLIEARMELEVATARLAAVRASEEDMSRLERLNAEWVSLSMGSNVEAAAQANVDFHLALTEAAYNPVFTAFVGALGHLLFSSAAAPLGSGEYPDRLVHSHEGILESVRNRKPDEAAVRMRRHLDMFRPDLPDIETNDERKAEK